MTSPKTAGNETSNKYDSRCLSKVQQAVYLVFFKIYFFIFYFFKKTDVVISSLAHTQLLIDITFLLSCAVLVRNIKVYPRQQYRFSNLC